MHTRTFHSMPVRAHNQLILDPIPVPFLWLLHFTLPICRICSFDIAYLATFMTSMPFIRTRDSIGCGCLCVCVVSFAAHYWTFFSTAIPFFYLIFLVTFPLRLRQRFLHSPSLTLSNVLFFHISHLSLVFGLIRTQKTFYTSIHPIPSTYTMLWHRKRKSSYSWQTNGPRWLSFDAEFITSGPEAYRIYWKVHFCPFASGNDETKFLKSRCTFFFLLRVCVIFVTGVFGYGVCKSHDVIVNRLYAFAVLLLQNLSLVDIARQTNVAKC